MALRPMGADARSGDAAVMDRALARTPRVSPFAALLGLFRELLRVVAEWLVRRRPVDGHLRTTTAPVPMRAMVYDRYGAPTELHEAEVPRPVPGEGQVLVRVLATSVNALDRRMLRASPFLVRLHNGLLRPKRRILGADVAGVVVTVGPGVERLRPGDRVFGDTSYEGLGGFAEYACVQEDALALLPENLAPTDAATLPLVAGTALQAVRDRGQVRPGDRVLVDGAGGGVGTALVQVAKAYGATVTVVAGGDSLPVLRALGADHAIDRAAPDREAALGEARFDVVFGVNGGRPLGEHLRRLVPRGRYVMVGGDDRQIFEALLLGGLRGRLAGRRVAALTLDRARLPLDLAEIRALVEKGALRPVVERVRPLAEAAAAVAQLEAGHVGGKIALDARGFGHGRVADTC